MLRIGGMPVEKLNYVFCALVNRRLYYLSAWVWFLNAERIDRINSFLVRARQYLLSDNLYDCMALLERADYKIFEKCRVNVIV
jgi:hypothetical protein